MASSGSLCYNVCMNEGTEYEAIEAIGRTLCAVEGFAWETVDESAKRLYLKRAAAQVADLSMRHESQGARDVHGKLDHLNV